MKPPVQRSFYCQLGDLGKLDSEVNRWLCEIHGQGYEVLSRDQITTTDMKGVYVTYALQAKDAQPSSGEQALQKRCKELEVQVDMLRLAFRRKEDLVALILEASSRGEDPSFDEIVRRLKRD